MPTARAKVGDTVIAETDTWENVEGNVYFPPSAIKDMSQFSKTNTSTHCPWKGDASYYTISVGGTVLTDAAWFYSEPKEEAKNIKDHVAFYKNKVKVSVE